LLVAEVGRVSRAAIGSDLDRAGEVLRYVAHAPGGLVTHAVRSAIEQALVDLIAQPARLAISAHLCPTPRPSVPAYANINRSVTERSPAGFAAAAQRAIAAGYRAVKLAPFDGVIAADAATTPFDAKTQLGLDRVFAVRDAIGAAPALMVDCHWRFDEKRAARLIRDLSAAKPYWIECPISEQPSCFPAIARLTRLAYECGMKSAGGEMIAGVDQAETMCEAGLYDVLMPDIKYAGGYRGMLDIANVCARHGKDFSPAQSDGPHCACRERALVRRFSHAAVARASVERESAVRIAGGWRRRAARRWGVCRSPRAGAWREGSIASSPATARGRRFRRRESRSAARLRAEGFSMSELFPGFVTRRVATSGAEIHCVVGGNGPPLLLLHGYPQTHAIWHRVAPRLAERYTVVCSDLRGYGDSSKPESDDRHFAYSKRAMARDQVELMQALGFSRFKLAGH
jgi:L-alanine-DL-glutamate epimerase-like enolase superfamily enzyme